MELFAYNDPSGASPVAAPQPAVAALAAFGPEEWADLREFAAERRYLPGAVILPAADATPTLAIIVEGEVAVQSGNESAIIGAGGLFGVSRFLDQTVPDVAAQTASGATVLMLTQPGLTRLAAWRPRTVVLLLGALGALLSRQLHALGRSS
jgi:CRP-like cAMP-binding protein